MQNLFSCMEMRCILAQHASERGSPGGASPAQGTCSLRPPTAHKHTPLLLAGAGSGKMDSIVEGSPGKAKKPSEAAPRVCVTVLCVGAARNAEAALVAAQREAFCSFYARWGREHDSLAGAAY